MSKLFRQQKQLIINDVVMPDLEIDFNVKFQLEDEQIVNDVAIANLTPETIRTINKGDRVIINAGYGDNMGNVLVGTIADMDTNSDNVDRILNLMVKPDINIILSLRVCKSYTPGTMASFIIKDLLNEINVEVGTVKLDRDVKYEQGKVFNSTVNDALTEIVAETNSFMFVRCNIIYIIDSIYEIDTGILLNKSTGLIGSPEIIDIGDAKGYKITCLLNPMLTLGSIFRLESRYLSGLFRVQNGQHDGSSFVTTVNCYPTDEVSRYVPPVKEYGDSAEDTPKGQIWTFLINKGFSKAATAGVMGNIQLESNFDPSAENSIGAYGLFQWLGDRRSNLEAYASSKNAIANDLYLQLDYFYYEITDGAESGCFSGYGGLQAFKDKTDPVDAAIVFEQAFERSGGEGMSQRKQYAQEIFAWDGGAKDTDGSGSGDDGNFPAGAFKCKCGCGLDAKPAMKNKMNQVWEKVGGGIQVTSGARCPYQNRIDDGVSDSLHLSGEAVDCYKSGASIDTIYNAAQAVGCGTLRYYGQGFIHIQMYAADRVM